MKSTGKQQKRGVALVAVLSVLVVLALLAASLAVIMQIEATSARIHLSENQLYMLLDSCLAHAKSLVYISHAATGEKSTMSDLLLEEFAPGAARGEPHWINVVDTRGALLGRYMLQVEDEAGKANLNSAFLTAPSQGSGWTPGEINLPLALGVSPKFAETVIGYRYGANRVPGARGDDDENNIFLMTDGIDNDADGVVDEDDEGVEDPGEYNAFAPQGDDRAFTGVTEALRVMRNSIGKMAVDLSVKLRREIPQRATLYSMDIPKTTGKSEDDVSDINVLTPRECRSKVGRANQLEPFGATQNQLNQLAVNMVDYRDQNHVLSTLGAQYGVEAVNFNEVLANDGTTAYNSSPAQYNGKFNTSAKCDSPDFVWVNYSMFCPASEGIKYHKNQKYVPGAPNTEYSTWDVKIINQTHVKLLGPSYNYGTKKDFMAVNPTRSKTFDYYYNTMARDTMCTKTTYRYFENGNDSIYRTFQWPNNMFKEWSITAVLCTNSETISLTPASQAQSITIKQSSADGTLTLSKPLGLSLDKPGHIVRANLWSFYSSNIPICGDKNVPLMMTVQDLQPRKYYIPVANNWSNHKVLNRVAHAGFSPLDKLDRDDRKPRSHKLMYGADNTKDCAVVQANSRGVADVFYKSGSDAVYDPAYLQYSGWCGLFGVSFMRPEVLELINVGPRALSLRGWTLTLNSGSAVNDVGIIDYGRGYSLRASQPDPNPVIAPNGYFYGSSGISVGKSRGPQQRTRNPTQNAPHDQQQRGTDDGDAKAW